MSGRDVLDELATFGQYKDTATWRQVAERDPDYARWLVVGADATPDEVREALSEELEADEWGF